MAMTATEKKEKVITNCNEFILNNNQELIAFKIGGYCNSNNYSKKELKDKNTEIISKPINYNRDESFLTSYSSFTLPLTRSPIVGLDK